MSAFVCQPEHIGLVAAYVARSNHPSGQDKRTEQAVRYALTLARQNIDSVAARYPGDKDGERPGCALKDQQIISLSAIWAEHFSKNLHPATPVEIIKLAQCLSYQSCETSDYETTTAARIVGWAITAASRNLPGYEAANWEYNFPTRPQAVIDYLQGDL